jgi:protein phosphatase PTC1
VAVVADVECQHHGEPASGSTACVCLIRTHGPKKYLYAANCGDARAVLCKNGRALRLTRVRAVSVLRFASVHPAFPWCLQDHKATDDEEKARIEAAGGFVLRNRVMGVLAVARSFGDFVLKKYVTAEPFTSSTRLDSTVRLYFTRCCARLCLYACLTLWGSVSS